jgi:hypothetical protein
MKIITPIAILEADYSASNVPETDYAVYGAGTTYALGDYCISTTTHTVYRSLIAGNIGNDPDTEQVTLADPVLNIGVVPNWQVIGFTNKWRLFDKKPSQLCTNPNTITASINIHELIQSISMFNLSATTVLIELFDNATSQIVYSKTIQLYDPTTVFDWYSYYFGEFLNTVEFSVSDLPPYADARLDITITNQGGTASVGQVVFGTTIDMGFVEFKGSGFKSLDFSSVSVDAYGNLETVKREATRLADYSVVVDNSRLQELDRRLRGLRGGTPAVWVGSDDPLKASLIYGFFRDYRVDYAAKMKSIISIQVQGIV